MFCKILNFNKKTCNFHALISSSHENIQDCENFVISLNKHLKTPNNFSGVNFNEIKERDFVAAKCSVFGENYFRGRILNKIENDFLLDIDFYDLNYTEYLSPSNVAKVPQCFFEKPLSCKVYLCSLFPSLRNITNPDLLGSIMAKHLLGNVYKVYKLSANPEEGELHIIDFFVSENQRLSMKTWLIRTYHKEMKKLNVAKPKTEDESLSNMLSLMKMTKEDLDAHINTAKLIPQPLTKEEVDHLIKQASIGSSKSQRRHGGHHPRHKNHSGVSHYNAYGDCLQVVEEDANQGDEDGENDDDGEGCEGAMMQEKAVKDDHILENITKRNDEINYWEQTKNNNNSNTLEGTNITRTPPIENSDNRLTNTQDCEAESQRINGDEYMDMLDDMVQKIMQRVHEDTVGMDHDQIRDYYSNVLAEDIRHFPEGDMIAEAMLMALLNLIHQYPQAFALLDPICLKIHDKRVIQNAFRMFLADGIKYLKDDATQFEMFLLAAKIASIYTQSHNWKFSFTDECVTSTILDFMEFLYTQEFEEHRYTAVHLLLVKYFTIYILYKASAINKHHGEEEEKEEEEERRMFNYVDGLLRCGSEGGEELEYHLMEQMTQFISRMKDFLFFSHINFECKTELLRILIVLCKTSKRIEMTWEKRNMKIDADTSQKFKMVDRSKEGAACAELSGRSQRESVIPIGRVNEPYDYDRYKDNINDDFGDYKDHNDFGCNNYTGDNSGVEGNSITYKKLQANEEMYTVSQEVYEDFEVGLDDDGDWKKKEIDQLKAQKQLASKISSYANTTTTTTTTTTTNNNNNNNNNNKDTNGNNKNNNNLSNKNKKNSNPCKNTTANNKEINENDNNNVINNNKKNKNPSENTTEVTKNNSGNTPPVKSTVSYQTSSCRETEKKKKKNRKKNNKKSNDESSSVETKKRTALDNKDDEEVIEKKEKFSGKNDGKKQELSMGNTTMLSKAEAILRQNKVKPGDNLSETNQNQYKKEIDETKDIVDSKLQDDAPRPTKGFGSKRFCTKCGALDHETLFCHKNISIFISS